MDTCTVLKLRRGTLAKSSKRRHVVNVGVCNVHFFHLLPYATLVWVGKSAFIAFIIICVEAPADAKGGAPVVRAATGQARGYEKARPTLQCNIDLRRDCAVIPRA